MEWLAEPQAWMALLTLTALEIVLGIDNIVFIAILAGKLPRTQQAKGRTLGLALAMISRVALLVSIFWLTHLTAPLVTVFDNAISGRDLILILGGLFLIGKSTFEIHEKLEGEEGGAAVRASVSFWSVITQIILIDLVFSVDSVITAIGMANQIAIMIAAVVIAVIFMMAFAGAVSAFIERRPTVKMLALSFLLVIGFALVAEGWDLHIPKGYIYFAMAFSIFVEMLNLKLRQRGVAPVKLRRAYASEQKGEATATQSR